MTQGNKGLVPAPALIVVSTILCSVVAAAIATPVYKQHYYLINGELIYTWFTLGLFFVLEFVIKVLANGFIFTFNAYLLNTWNHVDFLVLGTLVLDILASLVYGGLTSRFTRSLRALRMINLTMSMRETLYNVLILGFGNLMDASVLMYDQQDADVNKYNKIPKPLRTANKVGICGINDKIQDRNLDLKQSTTQQQNQRLDIF
ncbi:hypothetical protein PTTG_02154 [Puccinia triticina 1-1 BBBD Race 1]|uniref:Ion_trans domain-containing protein n=1 Tax=Puccinia triticina (isolate 1-1 / race 1 (BBBD)) TaxID=630390 RepID=A0A0C4EN14_PUCT1|nr:hypothetical protein PTTG_02154 [Puccinia triticina 1-1 BBBD Race 1]